MAFSEEELIEMDYEGLRQYDAEVMLIVGSSGGSVSRTRLQKLTLLFDRLYDNSASSEHEAYFFGGYSDKVDEAASSLAEVGVIRETSEGYRMTAYGEKLRDYTIGRLGREKRFVRLADSICSSLSELPDRNVVGLTYHYYSETAVNSTIKKSVQKLNDAVVYNGRKLSDISREEFEGFLREGSVLRAE